MRPFALLLPALVAATAVHAEVPVDEKPLSAGVQTRPLVAPQPVAAPAPVSEGNPSVQWDIYQQLQQLQQEVRQLRGQVEVQANQIERLKQDAKTRYVDLDQRINQLGSKVSALPVQAAPTDTATVTPPPAVAPAAGTPADATVKPPSPDDEKKAYFAAYEVFRSGGPNKAINPMREFIKNYPQSTYIPGAYYWLGEFYLAASPADVNNARKSFRIVADQFPDSPKTPAALYKLASLADVDGKTQEAARYLQDIVKRFNSSPEAASARAWLKEHNIAPAVPEKPKAPDAVKPATPVKPAPAKVEAKVEAKDSKTDAAKSDSKGAKPAAKSSDKPEKAKTP